MKQNNNKEENGTPLQAFVQQEAKILTEKILAKCKETEQNCEKVAANYDVKTSEQQKQTEKE